MTEPLDINHRYLDAVRQNNDSGHRPTLAAAEHAPSPAQRLAALVPPAVREAISERVMRRLRAGLDGLRLVTLLGVGGAMFLVLRVRAALRGGAMSSFTRAASAHVPELVEQYPMHLYPVVAKAGEFAFLEERLRAAVARGDRVLEVAIGEGTFSQRLFPPSARVLGLDLNPYSLCKAVRMAHVERAVVADCTMPPVRAGAVDLLLANNFLHHVSDKHATLAHWSRIAPRVCFNENTTYWASGFVVPFVLRRLGFPAAAARETSRIEATHWQQLWDARRLDEAVARHMRLSERRSFMSERTFFLCAVFSWLMGAYGPPTPPSLKRAMRGPLLRHLVLPLTTALARELLRFDDSQNRGRDAFVCYQCDTGVAPDGDARRDPLACPDCNAAIRDRDRCSGCGRAFLSAGGMLFVLPKALDDVREGYDEALAAALASEHL